MRLRPFLLLLAAVSCSPDFDRSASLIIAPRLLAVRAEPPESAPSAEVVYSALVVTPTGETDDPAIAWSFCTTPPALVESGAVGSACLAGEDAPVASGPTITATTPSDACRRFGPLGMPVTNTTQVGQPVAPDETGGSYQPIRLAWQGGLAFTFERLTCDPRGVSMDVASAYRTTHEPNRNPRIATFTSSPVSASVVDLTVTWTSEDIETYVTIDPATSTLVSKTERLWVAWFVTGGQLDHDATPAPTTDLAASNRWNGPLAPGSHFIWAVLHDDRGGLDFASLAFTAQ